MIESRAVVPKGKDLEGRIIKRQESWRGGGGDIFIILLVMMISCVYIGQKYRSLRFKYTYFIVCQLLLSKTVKWMYTHTLESFLLFPLKFMILTGE